MALTVSKNQLFKFSHINTQGSKVEFDVNRPRKIMLTTFEGYTPQCQVPWQTAFGPREEHLKGFTIYGHGHHLGHVIRTVFTNLRSPSYEFYF